MKKLLLLALVMLGGVMSASADDFLAGEWKVVDNNWVRDNDTKFSYTDGVGTLTLNLAGSTSYSFGLANNDAWKVNGGVMCFNNCTNWEFGSGNVNCTIYTTIAGDYTFTITWSDSKPYISVTYPGTYDDVVYFCNTVNWTQPYAYILHSDYWDNSKGSGSQKQPNGIAMTNIIGTNIWKAEFPTGARSGYIAFTKDKQDGYGNFYATEAVFRSDFPTSGACVYVPETTASGEYNKDGDIKTPYYNNGEWHAYPTYTRSVTSGNYGTICLPFNGTVSGATLYGITSKIVDGDNNLKGINISEVGTSLTAGQAYIFKATDTDIEVTLSGSYADAITGGAMVGNYESSYNVTSGMYIIKDNKLWQAGSGVTIGQYRAYIDLTNVQAASRGANSIFFGDDATGIESVQNEISENVMFNLQGQRVNNAQKGLVIVDGKKMLRK